MKEYERMKRNQKYCYYKTILNSGNSHKYIETTIGHKDLDKKELDKRRKEKSIEHFLKIWNYSYSISKKNPFIFKYLLDSDADSVKDQLFIVDTSKMIYKIMLKALDVEEIESIKKQMFHRHVYGTTQIEGNPLNYKEVEKVLDSGRSIENQDVNAINEIDKFETLRQNLKKINTSDESNERQIKKIHKILMDGLYRISFSPYYKKRILIKAGIYRTVQVKIGNSLISTCKPENIKNEIIKLIDEYKDNINENVYPIENIAIFHQKFEQIHPFEDGNGRTGREILNLMLIQNEYPPIYLRKEDNKSYYDALQEGDLKNYLPLIKFIIDRISASLLFYFSKTSIYEILISKVFQELLLGKQNKQFTEMLKYYHEDNTKIP